MDARLPALLAAAGLVLVAGACSDPLVHRRELLTRAEAARSRGDGARAVTLLESVLALDPRDVETTVRLATWHLAAGRPRKALAVIDRLPRGAPRPRDLQEARGRALLSLGRTVEAIRVLADLPDPKALPAPVVLEIQRRAADDRICPTRLPALPDAWVEGIGRELLARGDVERADAWVARVPDDRPARRALVDRLLEIARTTGPALPAERLEALGRSDDSPETLLAEREAHRRAENWAGVMRAEDRFLERYPEHPARAAILLSVAQRFQRLGQPERALTVAHQALEAAPHRPEPRVVEGLALKDAGRLDEARAAFEAALQVDPDHVAARRLLDALRKAADPTDRPPPDLRLRLDVTTQEGS